MLHSDKGPQSPTELLKARHDYALNGNEPRYARELTTGREIGASLVFWPTMNFEKSLLYREPLRDPKGDIMRGANGNILTYAPKDNAVAVAYRLGTNVLFKQYLAQYGRAFSVAYNNNRDFRHALEVGNDLMALAQTAQSLDPAPQSLTQEIRAAMSSPVQDMVSHSIGANRLLTQFASGEMETTPANIAALAKELDGLSLLAQERAGALKGMMAMRAYAGHTPEAMSEDLAEFSRPSGFIRDVLKLDRVTSMRQSQILFAFAAGLMAEGVIPLSQEELFIPQEHIYIKGQEAVNMARFLSDAMRKNGFSLNVDAKGQPLVDGVPPGAILKMQRSANGGVNYVPLNEAETGAFATQLLGYMKTHFAKSMDRLLAYADEHYADVQTTLLGNAGQLRSYHDELKAALKDSLPKHAAPEAANTVSPELTTPWQGRVEKQKNIIEQAVSLPGEAYKQANRLYAHLSRPEAAHEMHKLFARGVPTYILNFPVGLVSNMLLGFTKKDANWKHIPLTRENWKKHGVGLVVTPESIKSELFQLMVYPLVESVGSVGMVELARYPRAVTLDAAKHMDDVLLAAVKTAGEQDGSLKSGIEALSTRNPAAEIVAEHPEYAKVMEALEGKPTIRTAEDYELLAKFYHEVSDRVARDAAPIFTPYLQNGESFKEALHHVTHKPVGTVSEAALALSFLRSVACLNQKNITWLEYLPPEVAHLDHKQFAAIAGFMNEQAKNAGLAVFNPKTMNAHGIEPGELIHRDDKTGAIRRASGEEIIRLANLGTQKFREAVKGDALEDLTTGRYSDRYIEATEKLLFAQTHFAPVKEGETKAPEQATAQTGHTLQPGAKPWDVSKVKLPGNSQSIVEAAKYAVRPEAQHQMNKLFWRMMFTRLLYMPNNISENWLWKHKIKVDPNAPLSTQLQQFFGSPNVKQAMWTVASFPVTFSYGVTALWEFGSYLFGDRNEALEQSSASSRFLSAAIRTGAKVDTHMPDDLAQQEGTNPAMMALQSEPQFQRLPEIFAKPAEERSSQETALVQNFFDRAGDMLLEDAGAMLGGNTKHDATMKDRMKRLISAPATNIAEATRKLAFTQSMIDLNREYSAMIRYFDPDEQLIDTSQLAQLSTYIHKQAIGAGLVIYDPHKPTRAHAPEGTQAGELLERRADGTLKPASADTLIRFANVVGDKLAHTVNPKHLDKALSGELAEQYLQATDRNSAAALKH